MHSILRKPIEDFGIHTAIQLGQAQEAASHRRVPNSVSFQIALHLQPTEVLSDSTMLAKARCWQECLNLIVRDDDAR